MVEVNEEYSPIARLIELGGKRNTSPLMNPAFFPEAERISSNWRRLFRHLERGSCFR